LIFNSASLPTSPNYCLSNEKTALVLLRNLNLFLSFSLLFELASGDDYVCRVALSISPLFKNTDMTGGLRIDNMGETTKNLLAKSLSLCGPIIHDKITILTFRICTISAMWL
jgi:hypothetical protein